MDEKILTLLTEMNERLKNLETDVSVLKTDVSNIKEEVSEINKWTDIVSEVGAVIEFPSINHL